MKSLTVFSLVLLHEMGKRCGTSTIHDGKTITERVEHEGISFLTISLPAFGKDFEKSLDQKLVDRNAFQGFARKGGLPRFLGGFLDRVFDRGTGCLLQDPDIDCIFAIRQLTLAFGKVQIPCSDERVSAAIKSYLKSEQDLRESDAALPDFRLATFRRISRLLWADLFSDLDLEIYRGALSPKHGPGATADRLAGNRKWDQFEWTDRLETYFPMGEYAFTRWGHFNASTTKFLEPSEERPVRVITVPKTLKTPRIIAIEPTCMQYVQQSIHSAMKREFRAHDFASEFICYDSQLPNRQLAREGSVTGTLATLDLSEASDRVSNQHVLALFADHPHLRDGVQACRSRKADVNGKTIRLAKFASMGSALTFPIEALVFCTLVFCGIESVLGHQLTKDEVKLFFGRVRVYGDDIIIPVEYVLPVIDWLTSFGMIVNRNKSFWTGQFRESCGGDYYAGTDVTPVRVRRVFPTSLEHVDEIVSTVALRNNLFEAGFVESVEFLDVLLGGILPVYPEVPRQSQGLGRWTHSPIQAEKFHPHLHRPLVKACVVEHTFPTSELEGYGALTKWFLMRGDLPLAKDHLQRAGRPHKSRIKMRWIPTSIYGWEKVTTPSLGD